MYCLAMHVWPSSNRHGVAPWHLQSFGAGDGASVGTAVGTPVGGAVDAVGALVGPEVGLAVGRFVGVSVGTAVATSVGAEVGVDVVGTGVGSDVSGQGPTMQARSSVSEPQGEPPWRGVAMVVRYRVCWPVEKQKCRKESTTDYSLIRPASSKPISKCA